MTDPDPWRQLEQHVGLWSWRAELERTPLEREHEHRIPPRSPPNDRRRALTGTRTAQRRKGAVPHLERENKRRPARSVAEKPRPSLPAFIMKTFTNLWATIIDFENLYRAYCAASRSKRYRLPSLRFAENLEENLITLQNELVWKTYHPGPLREFWITDPKKRLISAPEFRDRVIHHALVSVIEPCFERRFIYESHACRKNHGVHLAAARLQTFTRRAGEYRYYKGDIKSYFPSIDHETLKRIVRRSVSDRNALWLIDLIIDAYREGPRGLPIGALTSQLFANVYLDQLDHFAKDVLGIRFYVRYMDDFIILGKNKAILAKTRALIESFLSDELRLTINPKSGIGSGKIPFCGYYILPTHITPRRQTMRRAARRLRKLSRIYNTTGNRAALEKAKTSIVSFCGYLRHCASRRSCASVLNKIIFRRLPK
jgi:retron-type reverse transcriptase